MSNKNILPYVTLPWNFLVLCWIGIPRRNDLGCFFLSVGIQGLVLPAVVLFVVFVHNARRRERLVVRRLCI